MRHFIPATSALALALSACSDASHHSPLDRPVAELQRDIAQVMNCEWEPMDYKFGSDCQASTVPYDKASLGVSAQGVESLSFSPFLYDADEVALTLMRDGTVREGQSSAEQQANVLKAFAILFPTWKERDVWMKEAIKHSAEELFQTSIRVKDTSIYVRYAHYPTGAFPEYAYIVVTRDKALHRFKYAPCTDDDQGWAREGCTADDGYTMPDSRPPDNPIMMPK
jgi:hypothetical protein